MVREVRPVAEWVDGRLDEPVRVPPVVGVSFKVGSVTQAVSSPAPFTAEEVERQKVTVVD